MFYYGIRSIEDPVARVRTVEGLKRLRGALDQQVPRKNASSTLLLASWNIREFDSGKYGWRSKESYYYIAEILSRFDLVAVQEVRDALADLTAGRGPDSCIDAVGMEAHGLSPDNLLDMAKMTVKLTTDRPHVLREAILACRKGGTVSVPGVYGGFVDKIPFGAIVNKGLTLRSGQTHVMRYLPTLLDHIEQGRVDPTFLITHRLDLEEAPKGYRMFKKDQDEVHKVVLRPQ